MAPDSERKEKERKEKKDKKRKHSESAAAPSTTDLEILTERSKKKDKKRKSTADASTSLLNTLEAERPGAVAVDADGDVVVDAGAAAGVDVVKDEEGDEAVMAVDVKPASAVVAKMKVPTLALVPFANPLCDEKAQKKVLKGVKKAAKSRAIKRGVKEVVKSIRKSQPTSPASTTTTPPGLVILAADISPIDIISHIPVLCEDHNIPYLYLPSRAELGAAGSTKRPTSVVMLMPKPGREAEEAEKGEWEGTFGDLVRLAGKLGEGVRI